MLGARTLLTASSTTFSTSRTFDRPVILAHPLHARTDRRVFALPSPSAALQSPLTVSRLPPELRLITNHCYLGHDGFAYDVLVAVIRAPQRARTSTLIWIWTASELSVAASTELLDFRGTACHESDRNDVSSAAARQCLTIPSRLKSLGLVFSLAVGQRGPHDLPRLHRLQQLLRPPHFGTLTRARAGACAKPAARNVRRCRFIHTHTGPFVCGWLH